MAFQLAEAFALLTVRDAQFRAGIDRARQKLRKLQERFDAIGRISRRVLLIGGAAAGFFVKMAADAEESLNKFKAVFGDLADEAESFAQTLSTAVGRSVIDVRDSLSVFQGFFVGLGFGRRKAKELSQQMSELALDFASFFNIADSEAVERFISALSGSGEVLDRFGINIKQAALDIALLEQGFPKIAKGATESQKALARISIIFGSMNRQGAVGDAERTLGSFTNQMKALKADARDLAVELGQALIPALLGVIQNVREVSPELKKYVEENKAAIGANTIFTAKLLAVGAALPLVLKGLTSLATGLAKVASGMSVVIALPAAAVFASWINQIRLLKVEMAELQQELDGQTTVWQELQQAIGEARDLPTAGNLQAELEATTATIKAEERQMFSLREEIAKLQADIAELGAPFRGGPSLGVLPEIEAKEQEIRSLEARLDTIDKRTIKQRVRQKALPSLIANAAAEGDLAALGKQLAALEAERQKFIAQLPLAVRGQAFGDLRAELQRVEAQIARVKGSLAALQPEEEAVEPPGPTDEEIDKARARALKFSEDFVEADRKARQKAKQERDKAIEDRRQFERRMEVLGTKGAQRRAVILKQQLDDLIKWGERVGVARADIVDKFLDDVELMEQKQRDAFQGGFQGLKEFTRGIQAQLTETQKDTAEKGPKASEILRDQLQGVEEPFDALGRIIERIQTQLMGRAEVKEERGPGASEILRDQLQGAEEPFTALDRIIQRIGDMFDAGALTDPLRKLISGSEDQIKDGARKRDDKGLTDLLAKLIAEAEKTSEATEATAENTSSPRAAVAV